MHGSGLVFAMDAPLPMIGGLVPGRDPVAKPALNETAASGGDADIGATRMDRPLRRRTGAK